MFCRVLSEMIDSHLPSAVPPYFGHAEPGIDWKSRTRIVMNIDLHNDVRRRVRLEVQLDLVADQRRRLNIETRIRFVARAALWLPHRRRTECQDVHPQPQSNSSDQTVDKNCVLFVFGGYDHSVQAPVVVADSQPRSFTNLFEQFLVFIPAYVSECY